MKAKATLALLHSVQSPYSKEIVLCAKVAAKWTTSYMEQLEEQVRLMEIQVILLCLFLISNSRCRIFLL